MILDLEKFLREAKPAWRDMESILRRLEDDPVASLGLDEAQRFHRLYERAQSDLARLSTFAFDPETRRYLEALVGRAYALIHDGRETPHRFAPLRWFFETFPRVFRRRWRAFAVALGAAALGAVFGAGVLLADETQRSVLMPFPHLHAHPSERVAAEEQGPSHAPRQGKAQFSSFLMTHNARVAVFCMALGITWGFGSLVILFYNGVIIGAVAADYVAAGETRFLLGWLLPHGAIEIPAFLIAGQAGLVLAHTLIGRGDRRPLGQRLRDEANDLATLIGGVAILLAWAAIVEAFLSQYHEPVIPYALKIFFGLFQLSLLALFLAGGKKRNARSSGVPHALSHEQRIAD